MPTHVHETPPPNLDEETQAKFEDLEHVEDLRPNMQLEAPTYEPEPIDTPDLIKTGETSAANAQQDPKLRNKMTNLIKAGEWKLAGTGKRLRRQWYNSAAALWLLGTLAVVGVGLITFAALTAFSG